MLKIAFCIPTLGRPHMATWNNFNNLMKPRASGDLLGESHFITIEDRPVDNARLLATQQALSVEGLTHVLWIDDDMTFPPDALQRLLAHDKDVIGGLCHNRRAPSYQPIAARKYDPALGMPQDSYGFVYDLPQSGLVEVDATGGAFLLVKAEVFKAIEARFGPNSWWVPQGEASEDFSFCRRAQDCGFKIFVDCGLDIGHFGTVEIHRKQADALRTFKTAPWIPTVDAAAGAPRVTVVIPTYNQKPAYLKAAVLSALNQTVPTEVIVVDDGTTDYNLGIETVLSSPVEEEIGRKIVWLSKRAKLIKHDTNRGISAALNTGIAHMTTDYFCWLSSDDIFTPNKVERQLNAMIATGAKASFHDYTVIDNTAGTFGMYVHGQDWRTIDQQMAALRENCCINGSTVMLHKDCFDLVPVERNAQMEPQFFDPSLRFAQDWEAWLRIAQRFLWLRVPEALGVRREGENLTAQIAGSPADDARRARRDEEDRIVRRRYAEYVWVARDRADRILGVFRDPQAAWSICGERGSVTQSQIT
jgi:glycosyltransferase involved in cell wall biosynthesis